MENLVLEKQIAFFSQDYSDAMGVETLKISITPTDIENIKKSMEILRANKFMSSIHVPLEGYVEYLNDEGEEFDEWRVDVERFVVYIDCVYYYAKNKWSSGDQIESEAIEADELGIVIPA
jgi:hypothetical protein